MIDLKQLREDPDRFREGCRRKRMPVDIDRVLALDAQRRALAAEQESLRAEQKRIAKDSGPLLGKLSAQLKAASGEAVAALQTEMDAIKARPAALKADIQRLDTELAELGPHLDALLLTIPMPPDPDVPVGAGSEDNIELSRWAPQGWDWGQSFEQRRGFKPRTHLELVRHLGLADFERGVRLAGSRSYILRADGARLHFAVLRYAMDFIAARGFTPMSVPVLVREEAMIGTGFFPQGREQAYLIDESRRDTDRAEPEAGSGRDLFLTGTGEVSLMGMFAGEILDADQLPLKLCTVSTCFRREAGAAGKDTAGLYRIHQFDKVEQVVICRADEAESRRWHRQMISIVEDLLKSLQLPHRLLQCCTGDLGAKNADMVDIECWMPGRGDQGPDGLPTGAFGETHSASRLYDYQCRRLQMRYRPGGEAGTGPTTVCHSLNNTVAASPRLLIPLLEVHQQADGSVALPEPLRPYLGGQARIGPLF